MGSAVNLQTRQVRKIMNELHQDHLVCEYERLLSSAAAVLCSVVPRSTKLTMPLWCIEKC